MSELKPKSFRIDDETAEKFKEISSSIGGNQQETLAKLIEVYEFQSGKAVLTEKKADIEQFERYVTAITRMFMGSLDDNRNMQETVRTEFDAQLKSKDTTIRSLQDDNKALKDERDQAVSIRDNLEEQIALLNGRINEYEKRLEDAQKMIADQESHVSLLKEKNQQSEQNAENSKQFQSENEALRQELAEIKRQLESQALEHQKSVLELREQHINETNALKEKHLKEIEEYQQKYKTELDKRSETQSQAEPKQKKPAARKTAAAKKPDEKKPDETAAAENKPES